jgi:hypothetical protein
MFLGDEGLSGWCLVGSVWWVERGLSEDFVGRYWLRIVWTVDDLLFEVQIQGSTRSLVDRDLGRWVEEFDLHGVSI